MTTHLYSLVAARAGHRCEYCHAPEALFNHRFPVDHIFPRVFGGSDELNNLALACHACNGHKYQKQMALDTTRKKLFRLFNPRQDDGEKHFRWNQTKTRMIGITAIGRTTIEALQLNSERQIEARILWQQIGAFSG
jgi:hypothetical protein